MHLVNISLLFSTGKSSAIVPRHDNHRLNQLLEQVLRLSPSARPTAEEIAVHPFFTNSAVVELKHNGQLVNTEQKLDVCRTFIRYIRRAPEIRSPKTIRINAH